MPVALEWGKKTYVMGIINVTPDSFSGDGLAPGGRDITAIVDAALEQGRAFVDAGAELLDVGAESTRPRDAYGDHPEIDPDAEAAIAVPVIRALSEALGDRAMVSVDTSRASVAGACVDAGATMVNDVWAGRRDPGTADVAAAAGTHLVLMHNQDGIDYPAGVFPAVVGWLVESVARAEARGVSRDRIVVDPGIGFGKGTRENLELLHRLAELKAELGGLPVLVGASRKRFLGELLGGAAPGDRLEGTAATVALAIAAGADIVRVHDVRQMSRVRTVADAVIRR